MKTHIALKDMKVYFILKPPRVPTLCLEWLDKEIQTVLDPVTSAVSAAQHFSAGTRQCSPAPVRPRSVVSHCVRSLRA